MALPSLRFRASTKFRRSKREPDATVASRTYSQNSAIFILPYQHGVDLLRGLAPDLN
jgi:hypothetical protein